MSSNDATPAAQLPTHKTDVDIPVLDCVAAASPSGDGVTESTGETPAADAQIGSWMGWAELENDPVLL